jgi:general secretion pathway protein D
VKNKEKAHILIGDKIPIITTTTSSTGFASDSVSYVDVGLKLDIEPVIYPDDGVSMKVALEVSSLGTSTTTSSGSVVYQIGTRDASTYLRLQDGETQLLAGLISKDEQNSASKIPGLGDLPVLGRFFSSQTDNGSRDEIVLAITPHILRNVVQPPASEAEIWVGTESAPRLKGVGGQVRYATVSDAAPPALAASAPAAAASQPGPAAPQATGADVAAPPNAPPPLIRSGVLAWKGPGEVKVGETFDAQVRLTGAVALMGLPIEVQFDPGVVELAGVDEGTYFKTGGSATSFTKSGDGRNGSIRMGVARSGEPAAAGEGSVYTLHFQATHPGEVWVNIVNAQPQAVAPQLAPSLPPALHVVVH